MRRNKPSQDRAALTAPETAAMFGVNRSVFYDLLAKGEAPVQCFRVGRKILIARQSVEELLGANAVSAFLERQHDHSASSAA